MSKHPVSVQAGREPAFGQTKRYAVVRSAHAAICQAIKAVARQAHATPEQQAKLIDQAANVERMKPGDIITIEGRLGIAPVYYKVSHA